MFYQHFNLETKKNRELFQRNFQTKKILINVLSTTRISNKKNRVIFYINFQKKKNRVMFY